VSAARTPRSPKKTLRNRPSARTLAASSRLFASPFDSRVHVANLCASLSRAAASRDPRLVEGETYRVGWHCRPRRARRMCLSPSRSDRRARGRGLNAPGPQWAWRKRLQRFRLVGEAFSTDTRSLATSLCDATSGCLLVSSASCKDRDALVTIARSIGCERCLLIGECG